MNNEYSENPLDVFQEWFERGGTDAVVVATATKEGAPSARMVLLRGADEHGFVFFTGYESLEESARVLALYKDGTPVQQLEEGQPGVVVLDKTPFYAESGGQVGDSGILAAEGVQFGVEDTQKI